MRTSDWFARYGVGVLLVAGTAALTAGAVRRYHRPGQLDVISAQAMDMSQMRPPAGAAPVQIAALRRGALNDTVTYTGTVRAYNAQDIFPRITGQLVSLPVYPGDAVRAGQIVARLDTAEVGAKAEQAAAEARGAELNQRIAELNHHQHHRAALEQADAQAEAAREGVGDARAEAKAADATVADARAAAAGAQASQEYWKTEIAREKQLADAGAASRQEYQSELSQSQAADASLAAMKSKLAQAEAMAVAARAKVRQAGRDLEAAQAMRRMAAADLALAREQANQAREGTAASRAAERQAAVVAGYARIPSPADGVVVDRPVAPGTLVQPGTVLLRVAEIDRVRVQANVAVTDLAGVRPGTAVEIVPQAAGGSAQRIAARVTSVFPAANETSRTAVVEVVVPNPRHDLLPGAFVALSIRRSAAHDGLLAPASAVVYAGGTPFLWVASDGSSAPQAQQYECVVCHMRYSAADAKKHGYRDPMDGGKLIPVPTPASSASPSTEPTAGLTVRRVEVAVGASDGVSTEVAALSLATGDRVVTRGQAGLTDGAAVVATAWGPDGPEKLPTAAQAMTGVTRYRCEVCGMTYSAEDARKNHYIDPMDGGRLVPVNGGAR
jgi:multidrug efflux pump subunit AcrA (membrane-fusion protein)